MKFVELREEEFQTFLDNHPNRTFLQTPEMAKVRSSFGYTPYFVGIKKDNELLAATMMGSKKTHFGFNEFYAPRGLLVDYENEEVLKFFTESLKTFIKAKKGYVLRIDPYYITKEKNIDGVDVENGINHSIGIKNLKNVGFKKCSDSYQQLDLLFALDLGDSIEELSGRFRPNTRNMIKKASELPVIIREASFEELQTVKDLIDETGERKNFHTRNLNYYELLHQHFSPKNEIKFMLGEIDVNECINKRKEIIKELEDNKTKIKKESKQKEHQLKIDKEKELLESLEQLKPNKHGKAIVSAGVYILYSDELVYLFSGNKKEYMQFGASYLMQWEMMQYAIKNNFRKYNFYGINSTSKKDGGYLFKRGFTGYVEELIGDYELKISGYYYIQKLIKKIRNH